MTGRWRRGREREREREVGRAHADSTLQGEESGVVVRYAKRECGIRDQLGVGRWSLNLGGLEIGRRRLDVERVAVFSCLIVHTSYGSWRFIPIHIVGRSTGPKCVFANKNNEQGLRDSHQSCSSRFWGIMNSGRPVGLQYCRPAEATLCSSAQLSGSH